MKKPLFKVLAVVLFAVILCSINSYSVIAKRCPGPYDIDDEELTSVPCKDALGQPTGQTKLKCVEVDYEMCCNSSLITACDAWEQ